MDGETVLGCYKIKRKIGEGFVVHSCFSCSGFSEVYLATDVDSGEPMALKKLKKKTRYKVRIRAVYTKAGYQTATSKWSAIKTVKTK